jgi:hypothetical protein
MVALPITSPKTSRSKLISSQVSKEGLSVPQGTIDLPICSESISTDVMGQEGMVEDSVGSEEGEVVGFEDGSEVGGVKVGVEDREGVGVGTDEVVDEDGVSEGADVGRG